MNTRILAAVVALLPCACAEMMYSEYSQPYVKFEAEHNQGLHGLFPATVVAVDGQRINAGVTPPFPPGMRAVTVEMRLQHDAYSPEQKTLQVDAKPCMRYYIASKHVGESHFIPVIAHEEPIKECGAPPASKSGGM